MQFKTDRIRDEWAQLAFKNMPLFDIVTRLHDYVADTYGREIVLTSIYRTPEENESLYKDTPLGKRPQAQPHTRWAAVDIRSSIFSLDEITGILAWLNASFKNPSGKATAIYHAIQGNVGHLHIQHITLPTQIIA
jgi:uncharacterized protein YcbK (DUF882 family)